MITNIELDQYFTTVIKSSVNVKCDDDTADDDDTDRKISPMETKSVTLMPDNMIPMFLPCYAGITKISPTCRQLNSKESGKRSGNEYTSKG